MSVNKFQLLVQEDFLATDRLVQETFDSIDKSIIRVKCILPIVTLLSCHACKYSGEEHIRLAAFSEILYTARLLHNNIDKKYVSPTDKKNILIGDCLQTQYLKLLLEIGNPRIIEFMSDITCTITYGDIKSMQNPKNTHNHADIKNNALLYAAACALGGYISQESEQCIGQLYKYGVHLGTALQLNLADSDQERQSEIEKAISCLRDFPESIYKQALETLASECSSAW